MTHTRSLHSIQTFSSHVTNAILRTREHLAPIEIKLFIVCFILKILIELESSKYDKYVVGVFRRRFKWSTFDTTCEFIFDWVRIGNYLLLNRCNANIDFMAVTRFFLFYLPLLCLINSETKHRTVLRNSYYYKNQKSDWLTIWGQCTYMS